MDAVDRKIIEELKENGRAPFTEIAENIDVSEGTVRNRVEKLREENTIEKFTVKIDESTRVRAFVSVDVSTERDFAEILAVFPERMEVFEIAGDIDLLVKISRETSEEINQVVDEIRAVDGVESTKTYMVLSSEN